MSDPSARAPDFRAPDRPADDLRAQVMALHWHHQIDFGNGLLSPGNTPIEILRAQADIYFRDGMTGKTFLDIGCWDGFNSFEARRRGAARVLATDHFAWSKDCWGDRRSFELARAHLAPDVEVRDIDLPDLSVETVGSFDVVLFAGVFYHLRHPFLALEKLAPLATDTFIVETHLDALQDDRPAMVFYPGRELADDPTNWWGPNPAAVLSMLRDVGFAEVAFALHPIDPSRGIFHAWRNPAGRPAPALLRAQTESDRLRAEIARMKASASWRLTAPLRAVADALRNTGPSKS
jgi:tRNA (mo5U34)-methyltransferase